MVRTSARLKDIALATGFSANTVSLALRESRRIPKETRDRILDAARQLNYLPNHVAQSLVSRETKTIGLVLTDIMNPTLTLAARSIERELASRGYSLMLAATDNVLDKEVAVLNVFRSRPLGNSEKYDGYTAALGEAGLVLDRQLVIDPHGHRATEGYLALAALMGRRKRPTALFAANDSLAIGALRWCRDNRVRVPADLA